MKPGHIKAVLEKSAQKKFRATKPDRMQQRSIFPGLLSRNINRYIAPWFTFLLLLSGCELTGQQKSPLPPAGVNQAGQVSRINFSRYYLSLKSLNPVELLDEIERIKQQQQENEVSAKPIIEKETNSEIYLLLLKSLPSSPIYNPYNAKDQLNQLPEKVFSLGYLSNEDLALLLLLKDQLNEQLFAQERITALEQEQALSQQKYNFQLGDLQSSLTQLQQKLNQLKKNMQ